MSRKRFYSALVPLKTANKLVRAWHRHSRPVRGHKYSIGLWERGGVFLVGAAIVGRPVSRHLQTQGYLEVTRLVTDGTPFACSALYRASVAQRPEGQRFCTYTLVTESGASLIAAGWVRVKHVPAQQWDRPSRPRANRIAVDRWRWEYPNGRP